MEKSKDAFRTISEVAEWLDVQTHVLRFWESRFSQIKPVKRAGGRRYYRPSDMRVIGGVKVLLHDQGMTIRAVQKLFREEGVKHVSSFSPDLHGEQENDPEIVEHVQGIRDLGKAVEPAPAAISTHDAMLLDVEEAEEQSDWEEPQEKVAARGNIPATPDVPEADPDDDAPVFSTGQSFTYRLMQIPAAKLSAHKVLISDAMIRLKKVRDRIA